MNLGFYDIETGGFSIIKNGICEISIIAVDQFLNPIAIFETLIKPYTREDSGPELVSYKQDAMDINGLTLERLISEGQEVQIAISAMLHFIRKHDITTMIGHNSDAFDIHRITYLVNRFTEQSLKGMILEDTMLIAKRKLSLPKYDLKSLCDHYDIINQKAHSAKDDALATLQLYKHLNS